MYNLGLSAILWEIISSYAWWIVCCDVMYYTVMTTLTKLRSLIFSCNISVVCNKLYVVLNNKSENKMKSINFVLSILRQTYPIIAHL